MPSTVLIVDDHAEEVSEIAAGVQQAGYRVVVAQSGDAAQASIERGRPIAALVRCVMRSGSGYTIAGAIHRDPATVGVPVIMFTGNVSITSRLRARQVGAGDLLAMGADLVDRMVQILGPLTPRCLAPCGSGPSGADIELIRAERGAIADEPLLNDAGRAAVLAARIARRLGWGYHDGEVRPTQGVASLGPHTWLVMPGGTVVDAYVGRFFPAVHGWPGHDDVAVIPASHELRGFYVPAQRT